MFCPIVERSASADSADKITEDDKALGLDKTISVGNAENGYVLIHAGSGSYHFAAPAPPQANGQASGTK